jgi:hypothetical protein
MVTYKNRLQLSAMQESMELLWFWILVIPAAGFREFYYCYDHDRKFCFVSHCSGALGLHAQPGS